MKDSTKSWIEYATQDFEAAKELIKNEFLFNVVLFHCQQTVEKIFKAFLEENNHKIPKTHSVVKLFALLPENIKNNLKLNILDLEKIEEIYIETRYPGELGLLPNGLPQKEEVEWFLNLSKYIFEKSKSIL